MSNASYRFNRIVCSLVVFAMIMSAGGFPLAAPRVQAQSQEPATSKVATTTAATPIAALNDSAAQFTIPSPQTEEYSHTLYLPLVVGGPVVAAVMGMRATPWLALPGDVVTYTLVVRNTGNVALADGRLVDRLPDEVSILTMGGGTYYTPTRELSWELEQLEIGQQLTVTFLTQVVSDAGMTVVQNDAVFTARAASEAPPSWRVTATATAMLYVAGVATATITPQGGELIILDGLTSLQFPPGAVSETVNLTVRILSGLPTALPMDMQHKGYSLDIQMRTQASGESITTLEQPVTLTINLRGLIDKSQLLPYQRLAIFRGTDDPEMPWSELQDTVEVSPGLLQASINHFSGYAAGATGNQPASWQLTYNSPVANLFSGAMTFNYPVQAPAGRNGLQPQISLAYNTRSIDGLVQIENKDTDGVPPGWSMDSASISRNKIDYEDCDSGRHRCIVFPDNFSLAVNGTNHDLFPETSGQTSGRYYAKDDPSLYVERRNDRGGNGSTENQTHEYWIIKTGEGTIYQLGYRTDSEQVISQDNFAGKCKAYCGALWDAGTSGAASRWRVDTVTDVLGNQMTFNYYTYSTDKSGDGIKSPIHSEHTRPTNIDYNFNGTTPTSRVVFANTDTTVNWINRIYVYNVNTSTQIREYRLDWNADLTRLNAITQYDGAGAQSLPPTTFTYETHKHGNGSNQYQFPYVKSIDNGYGARTVFTYLTDERHESDASRNLYYGYSFRVIETLTYDGPNSNPARVSFEYGTPCYDEKNSFVPGIVFCRSQDPSGYGPLIGHSWATRTVYDYNGSKISQDTHTFNIDSDNISQLRGRELQSQTYDPYNTLLTQVNNTYSTTPMTRTTFTYLSQTDATTYASGTSLTKRTTYAYDPANQGGAQYGNQTEQIEYDTNLQPYRRTASAFYPNLTNWIVNKLNRQNVYQLVPNSAACTTWYLPLGDIDIGGAGWCLVKLTRYSYDNITSLNAAPGAKGQLTAVRAWNGTIPVQFIDTVYTYDPTWGNLQTETTYDNYGDADNYASLNPKTTTTVYDDLYHLYPVQVTNAKDQTTRMTYDVVKGVPTAVTDANGAVTNYTYDTFGRLRKIIRPGDTVSNPSEEYRYYDGGNASDGIPLTNRWPLLIDHLVRNVAGLAWCSGGLGTWERNYYDGLGRQVEHQTTGPGWNCTSGGQEIESYTSYDAAGRVVAASVPYTVPQYVWSISNGVLVTPYHDPNLSQPRTTTAYDALGRATSVTAPDGTATTSVYYIASNPNDGDFNHGGRVATNVTDANNHVKRYAYDGRGNLQTVTEFVPGSEYRTRYTYDVLGNLKTVRDAAGNWTSINYDALSRKTDMADPDMGQWRYQYDNAGNLTAQDDAKSQRTCFFYDSLNRLTGKSYTTTPAACPAATTTYGYDTDANGVGHRVAMTDTSGVTTWAYDIRGRVVAETHTLAATLGTYSFHYTYNDADQAVTVTYPDGEVVTTAYNNRGQPATLSTNLGGGYVTGATYDAPGRLTQTGWSNGLQTTYDYYPFTQQGGRLRTITVGNTLLKMGYTYDPVGNVQSIADQSASIGNQTLAFGYDPLDRLTNATTGGGNVPGYDQGYAYDPIGRFINRVENPQTAPVVSTYAYTSTHPHAPISMGGNRYDYDANGNMTRRVEISGTRTITYTQAWNAENKLERVTWLENSQPCTTTFVYDGDGNRALKIEQRGSSELTTIYVGGVYEKQIDTTFQNPVAFIGDGREVGTGLVPVQEATAAVGTGLVPVRWATTAVGTGLVPVQGATTRIRPYDGMIAAVPNDPPPARRGSRPPGLASPIYRATSKPATDKLDWRDSLYCPRAETALFATRVIPACFWRESSASVSLDARQKRSGMTAAWPPISFGAPLSASLAVSLTNSLLMPDAIYNFTDNFNSLDSNIWGIGAWPDVTFVATGGLARVTRPSTYTPAWGQGASLGSKQFVNFTGVGAAVEWRMAIHQPASWEQMEAHLIDEHGIRPTLTVECSTGSNPNGTNPTYVCFPTMRDSTQFEPRYWSGSFDMSFNYDTFYTFRLVNPAPRQVDFYVNGESRLSKTFSADPLAADYWYDIDWVQPAWDIQGWPATGDVHPNPDGAPNVLDASLDYVSIINAVDNGFPTISVGGQAPNVWHTGAQPVTYSATDNGSGVRCVLAQWNNSTPPAPCYDTSGSTVTPVGTNTLSVFAWDWAGNRSDWSGTYLRDDTPPTLNPPGVTQSDWTSGTVTISVSASDSQSGVAYVTCSLDDGTYSTANCNPTFTANGHIDYYAADNVGLTSTVGTYTVTNIDKLPPNVPAASGTPPNPPPLSNWTKGNVVVTVLSNGDAPATALYGSSGVAYVTCSINDAAYDPANCTHTFIAKGHVDYYAMDNAGNQSITGTYTVSNIDKLPPNMPLVSASPIT